MGFVVVPTPISQLYTMTESTALLLETQELKLQQILMVSDVLET